MASNRNRRPRPMSVGPWHVLPTTREIKHRWARYYIDLDRIKTEAQALAMLDHISHKTYFDGGDVDSLAKLFAHLGLLRGRAA